MPRNAATQENTNNTENMEQQVPFKVTITEPVSYTHLTLPTNSRV